MFSFCHLITFLSGICWDSQQCCGSWKIIPYMDKSMLVSKTSTQIACYLVKCPVNVLLLSGPKTTVVARIFRILSPQHENSLKMLLNMLCCLDETLELLNITEYSKKNTGTLVRQSFIKDTVFNTKKGLSFYLWFYIVLKQMMMLLGNFPRDKV